MTLRLLSLRQQHTSSLADVLAALHEQKNLDHLLPHDLPDLVTLDQASLDLS
ncbi:MAG: hypothetical protein H6765_06850 [Candidatus Peribacteria bacterium]|nr:MAG: hypothetical protein H6765_06850 [Candidatus Peribacteria bacterium]